MLYTRMAVGGIGKQLWATTPTGGVCPFPQPPTYGSTLIYKIQPLTNMGQIWDTVRLPTRHKKI